MRTQLYLLLALVFIVSACSEEPAGPVSATDPSDGETATFAKTDNDIDLTDRYIVVFKEGIGNPDIIVDEVTRGKNVKVHYRYRHALKGFAATIPEAALEGIRHNPMVDYIEHDGVVTAGATQNNPPSWGLDRIDQHNLPRDYSYTYQNTGTGVTVYIIDSGIRFNHTEYSTRTSSGWDFIDNDADASDCHGHGTHVAGTVGGTTVGVAKNVQLVAVRVLNCSGSGSYSAVIAGIDWVTLNHNSPAVANMSLGGGYSASLNTAVNNSVAAGVVYAVSAGNSNRNACNYSPASAASALTVGSTTSSDVRSSFSNYGTCVDIFAPGSSIYSSTMNSTTSYASWSGTSMASPHVAGVAALYLSANPNATPSQVEAAIKNGATTGVLSNIGTGSPNLLLYSQIAGSTTPTAPATPQNLTVSATTTTSVTLSWSDVSNEDGYRIERFIGSTWTQVGTTSANVTTFTESSLAPSTTYQYRMYAYNSVGSSGYASINATTDTPLPLPGTPTGLTQSGATSSSITLAWNDVSNETAYYIERDIGGTWTQVGTTGANVTTFTEGGLASSTTYAYRVYASNSTGNSGYANASATTSNPPSITKMYVADLDKNVITSRNKWYGQLEVTVKKEGGQLLPGATVTVSWTGDASGSSTAVTNASGVCVVTTNSLHARKVNNITMTVTNITLSGYIYDPSLNNMDPPGLSLP